MDNMENMENMGNIECLVDGAHGSYVPQVFAETCTPSAWGVTGADVETLLAGPDHPDYWEVWDDVLLYAQYPADDGRTFTLHQDGDLFAVAVDALTDDEYAAFFDAAY